MTGEYRTEKTEKNNHELYSDVSMMTYNKAATGTRRTVATQDVNKPSVFPHAASLNKNPQAERISRRENMNKQIPIVNKTMIHRMPLKNSFRIAIDIR